MLRTALLWTRSLLFSIPLILFFTVILGAASFLVARLGGRGKVLQSCRRLWARLVLAASFVHLDTRRVRETDFSQPCVVCANHLSYLDPAVVVASLEMPVCFLAKRSLFRIPFLGWAMAAAGDIPLDRQDARQGSRSLAVAAQRLRKGFSVVVFPEGTRSPTGQLQPFLSGAFRMAIQTQAPVLPVAISGTREALPPGSLFFQGGRVQLLVGQPILTQALAKQDKDLLADQARRSIEAMLPPATSPNRL
ncbi:MAG: 1-acyl-sn-glycerol-3-phosphate acyltransferase [Acidobacteria bacterium]|nr:1-acyl-sn-glycerol-3-phosphate acyltransferase [Acidobacteriota bacterium]